MSKTQTPKLNVLLAKTDALAPSFKKNILEYKSFFKDKQSTFRGEKKTYDPKPETIDVPTERGNVLVTTTVQEKLDWFVDNSKDYIDALFSQEATNASGLVKAPLIVDSINFGTFSSLELLRLKGLLENGDMEQMYATIPVRSDAELWATTTNEMYNGREVFESPQNTGQKKSGVKETYILQDPNLKNLKDDSKYTPQTAVRDITMILGDFTQQKFTGEWSQKQRAEVLQRRTKLLTAVIEALKMSNEAEIVPSEMTSSKLFGYLHTGNI